MTNPFGLALLAGGLLQMACRPSPPGWPLDRQTESGQRLWYLALAVPTLEGSQLDRQLARPLLAVLGKDPRAEVVGSLTRSGAVIVYLRSPVSVSSVELVERALGRIQLPDGTRNPLFGAAGPPGQAELALASPDPTGLQVAGLDLSGMTDRLASEPAWLLPPGIRSRPRFEWALRIEARDHRSLARLARQVPRARDSTPFPPADQYLRSSLDRVLAYFFLSGEGARRTCLRLAADRSSATCKARVDMADAERALLGWPLGAE